MAHVQGEKKEGKQRGRGEEVTLSLPCCSAGSKTGQILVSR